MIKQSNKIPVNSQIEIVSTSNDFVNTAFRRTVNAICWQRNLSGDFGEIVSKLQLKENVTEISAADLNALRLSAEGETARKIIREDLKLLTDSGAAPTLNLIKRYERDLEFDFIATDVYSYHLDRSPVATDTILCTYHGAASDIIPNNQVEQKISIPEIRRQLRDLYDGPEEEFDAFLKEHFFDLHYQAKPDGMPINLGLGHLWKLAVDYPGQTVLPCIHRAPVENEGEYRLLLIC